MSEAVQEILLAAGASVCMEAPRAMLRRVGLTPDRLPGYSREFGGGGPPRAPLEPEFPFE
jgi:hypothetical protein